MAYFIKSYRQLINIEDNRDILEITYDKYIEGFGYEQFTDSFNTRIVSKRFSNWYDSDNKSIRYEQFLDTMVFKTTETIRKMALVQLENILLENKNSYSLLRIMNMIKILDPTFIPPLINLTCSWQKRMMKEFCITTIPRVIESSTNHYRLTKFFRVSQLIESDKLY